jgi:hypothetical protein
MACVLAMAAATPFASPSIHAKLSAEELAKLASYNVVKPDFGPNWQV